jgi:hypothetical protein
MIFFYTVLAPPPNRGDWLDSRPGSLSLEERTPVGYPLDSQPERNGNQKNLALPEIETWSCSPYIPTTLTELSMNLLKCSYRTLLQLIM